MYFMVGLNLRAPIKDVRTLEEGEATNNTEKADWGREGVAESRHHF